MQGELEAAGPVREIRILGINEAGQESGNALIVPGRTLPWLQDVASQDTWSKWNVTYRDVIVLDSDNNVAGIYNLTERDLSKPADYDALKALLVEAASR